jgi:hypothetical protein
MQLPMFPKLCATVGYGSLECHPLGSVHSLCDIQLQGELASYEFHTVSSFLHGISRQFPDFTVLELKNHCSGFHLYRATVSTLYQL